MLLHLIVYLLSSMGLTILIVWPNGGPTGWIREKLLRRILPGKAKEVLDCYICLSFWAGLLLSVLWWELYQEAWIWFGCLMVPSIFWVILDRGGAKPN